MLFLFYRRIGSLFQKPCVVLSIVVALTVPSGAARADAGKSAKPQVKAAHLAQSRSTANKTPGVARIARQALLQRLPAELAGAAQTGPRSANAPMTVTVALRPPHPEALDAFVRDLHNSASPQYHRFLTPAEFTARFAPSPDDVATVAGYLQASGLKVTDSAANRLWVKASGNVAQMQQAFGTTIANYRVGQKTYFANPTPATLPPNLAARIESVYGLDNVPRLHPVYRQGAANPPFNPNQIRAAYNYNPFYTAGNRGKGKTIAIFSSFATTPSDNARFINDWIKTMPTTPAGYAANITYVNVDGGPMNDPGNGNVEADLDLEMAVVAAPDAAIRFYQGPYSGPGQYDTLAQIVGDNLADIASESYGGPEASEKGSGEYTLYAAAAAQGISYFCSSGDAGAGGGSGGSLSPDYPASDPNVIAVGGTSLFLNTSSQITNETGWNGSGGGISTLFDAPSWQANDSGSDHNALLNISNPGNKRLVPDVSLDADPNTGYLVYSNGGTYSFVGGTSVSCPLWAGAAALLENAIDNGGAASRQGNLNALFYQHVTDGTFRDIISGNNRQPSTGANYDCKAGYDLVTGLGSPDFQVVANAIAAASLYVDKSYVGTERGTPTQPFRTVAAAVNAASSTRASRIYIRANSYSEYPTITKPVTLLNWANTGVVTIGTP